ncbi:RNase H domain-containing protein [Caerostris darwini]|uniref:RNase H domain-containing protein n=1 Tax=Caerostris darwini TaxID=1538125 RepID=A0AAV4U040_9ARAC|nr:RNase H domain-containing protein [Caerostris darwini]
MLLLTRDKPFQDTMEMKTFILFEKLMLVEDFYWKDHVVTARQLKTQYGFIQKVLNIKNDLVILGDIQPLLTIRNPLEVINVNLRLDLVETIYKKRHVAPSVLKYPTLETITARYPTTDWLHIFTEGS